MYLIGLIVFFFLLQTAIAKWERRMVWPFGTPEQAGTFGGPASYGTKQVSDALLQGFRFLGWAPDLKGKMYNIRYALLVSPGRDCFAVIGMGTILSKKLEGTWLHTPTADGRSFYTTDNQAGIEIDISRSWKSHLTPERSFSRLWEKHREWISQNRITANPLPAGGEVEAFRKLREDHYRAMFNKGMIEFTDRSRTWWRYTFSGALRWAFLNYSIGLLRAVTFGRLPKTA